MTLRNQFTAAGANDIGTLRRSINNAFQSMVNQINGQQIVVKLVSELPGVPQDGQVVLLTATDGDNTAGVYCYDGTNWLKLS